MGQKEYRYYFKEVADPFSLLDESKQQVKGVLSYLIDYIERFKSCVNDRQKEATDQADLLRADGDHVEGDDSQVLTSVMRLDHYYQKMLKAVEIAHKITDEIVVEAHRQMLEKIQATKAESYDQLHAAQNQMVEVLSDLVHQEQQIRQECALSNDLRAVRHQLHESIAQLQAQSEDYIDQADAHRPEVPATSDILQEGQCLVYLYLFNATGQILANWEPMLSEKSLYEYSVNRPVYAEEKAVLTFIENKPPIERHAYVVFKIAKNQVNDSAHQMRTDVFGQTLVKLVEGVFTSENFLSFNHAGQTYCLKDGKLIAKVS